MNKIKMGRALAAAVLVAVLAVAFVPALGAAQGEQAQAASSYKIVYKLNGGTQAKGQVKSVKAGKSIKVSKLKKPTRKGYTFKAWYKNSKLTKKASRVYGKSSKSYRTVYAKWSINTYRISYVLNGGTQASGQATSYKVTSAVALKAPTKTGYVFSGWYSNAACTVKVTGIAQGTIGAKTFYAKWTPATYGITYVADEGVTQTGSYTYGTQPKLMTPTKSGYVFKGWYADAALTQPAVLTATSTGAKTFYAKWSKTTFMVVASEGSALSIVACEEENALSVDDSYEGIGAKGTVMAVGYDLTSLGAGEKTMISGFVVSDPMEFSALGISNFKDFTGLVSIDVTNLDVSNLTRLADMFKGLANLTTITGLETWDTSNVTDFGHMFNGCKSIKGTFDLSMWNMTKAIRVANMFQDMDSVTEFKLSGWALSSYRSTDSLQRLFYHCDSVTKIDVSNWTFSSAGVGGVNSFASYCPKLQTVDMTGWNVNIGSTMAIMFAYDSELISVDLSGITTRGATTMHDMFAGCTKLQSVGDLSGWDVSNCEASNSPGLYNMFKGCAALASVGDLSGWDVSGLSDLHSMFEGCSSLTSVGNLENWQIAEGANVSDFAKDAGFDTPSWTIAAPVPGE